MDFFFNPKSVAVIGASRNEKRPGHNVLKNLVELGYRGQIFPINPNVDNLLGLKVFPSINDVKDPVELVIMIIPNSLVPKVLRDCASHGVKGAVIISEGFAETGQAEDLRLQREIEDIVRKTKIRVLGPGTMGIVNLQKNFTSSYVEFKGLKTTGNITFMAQSGIFTGGLVRYFATYDLPVSRIISLGNKVDVDDADIFNYLVEDTQTKVIALYIEGINDGRRFIEAARKVSKKKPIVVLKGGKSPAGAQAASSHTGSLAVNTDIFEAAAKQAGLIQVKTLSELFETSRAFSIASILPKGPRIAIITYSGCLGVVSSDMAQNVGLQMATFSRETSEQIHDLVFDRKFGSNPIDTYPATLKKGNEHVFTSCLDLVLQDPNVDGALITVWGDDTPEDHAFSPHILDIILKYQKEGKFTIIPVLGEKLGIERERKFFEDNGIATTIFADQAIQLYKRLLDYSRFLKAYKE